jgi:N-acylneuraminate cytidylyltransferase
VKILFIIPARGGSKGIPNKNIKELGGKPLIHHSLDYARLFASDEDICLTTDSPLISECAMKIGYHVPFIRPNYLATDESGTFEVLQHAVNYYNDKGLDYDIVVLLQPTSPFREKRHLNDALTSYTSDLDMVVSVKETHSNPYYNLFEETEGGFLMISKGTGDFIRRQDVPPVFEFNGSIYIINTQSLMKANSFKDFKKIKKYIMPPEFSIDLDSMYDWNLAQSMFEKK